VTLYVGVMSGTSLDGIDVAVVAIEGGDERPSSVDAVAFRTIGYDRRARERIRSVIDAGSAQAMCELDFELGRRMGEAVADTLRAAGIAPADVRAIGSHGQTVWHEPPTASRPGSTLQLGRPAAIAEAAAIPVVSDLRARDMAAGGQGAPLTAYTDWLLFTASESRAIQNIGGMGNLTILPARGADATPQAFDTGPGVALLDGAVERLTNGRLAFDEDGRLARSGTVDEAALAEWLADPFFSLAPPRSTGRERFSTARLDAWLQAHPRLGAADAAATLTELTARSIADAFRFARTPVDTCYLCGGGARNPALVSRLSERLAPRAVEDLSSLGFDPDAREAVAFAVLARQHVLGIPANAPWATGAAGRRVLGDWTPS